MERRKQGRIRKVYGDHSTEYDDFLGGLFKSKHKKKSEKLEIKQKDANLLNTSLQNKIAEAKVQTETFLARAAQSKALAAQKFAETADTQLKGARASTQLKYLGMAIAAISLIGGVVLIVYIAKQGKRAALISAKLNKVKN